MRFTTDLQSTDSHGRPALPTSWAQDHAMTYEARGFLGYVVALLSDAETDLDGYRAVDYYPDDLRAQRLAQPPVGALVRGGYLVETAPDECRLIHPQRLGPYPQGAPVRDAETPPPGQ